MRSLFPEDEVFRRQLITVPSCDQHNSDKSDDDEYVANLISSGFDVNTIASRRYPSMARSFMKTPGKLAQLFRKPTPVPKTS